MRSIRERSGSVDGDKYTALIYTLLRDGDVPPGRMEQIVSEMESGRVFQFSNGWLAQYAEDLKSRLFDLSVEEQCQTCGVRHRPGENTLCPDRLDADWPDAEERQECRDRLVVGLARMATFDLVRSWIRGYKGEPENLASGLESAMAVQQKQWGVEARATSLAEGREDGNPHKEEQHP